MTNTFCPRCDLHVIENQRLRDELSALREAAGKVTEAFADPAMSVEKCLEDLAALRAMLQERQP